MIYQNIKNIINKVIISIPVAHLLTENMSIYSFKNYAAVLYTRNTLGFKWLLATTPIVVGGIRLFQNYSKKVKKTFSVPVAAAAPQETAGYFTSACSWVNENPWTSLTIVITVVVVGGASYYYLMPLIYGATSAAGGSDSKPSSGGDCPEIAARAEAIATVPPTPSVEIEAASSSTNFVPSNALIDQAAEFLIPRLTGHIGESPSSIAMRGADLLKSARSVEFSNCGLNDDQYREFILQVMDVLKECFK